MFPNEPGITNASSFSGGGGGGGAVDSVNGQTGVVVLTKSDIGLANVDNTSDANKPISTAVAAALALKAPLASPAFTGTATFNQILMPATVSPAVSLRMNDTDSGMGSDGDGIIFWSTNGTERLRLTAGSLASTLPISAPNFVYPSQAQGLFLASPQGGAGVPVFRAIGTAEISSSQIAFPFVIPNGASETDPQLKSDSDTGLAFPSDGLFNSINNNVVTMRWAPGLVESAVDFLAPNATITNLLTADFATINSDLLVSNDAHVVGALTVDGDGNFGNVNLTTINGSAYPPAIPTGTNNTFLAYDPSGVVFSAPHLQYLDTAANTDVIYSNTNTSVTANYRAFTSDVSGTVGANLTGYRFSSTADAASDFFGADIGSSGLVGASSYGMRFQSNSDITQNFNGAALGSSGLIGGDFLGVGVNNSGVISGNFRAFTVNNQATSVDTHSVLSSVNTGDVTNNFAGISMQNSGNVGGNLGFLDLSTLNGATITGDVQMIHISSDSTVTGNETLMNVHSGAAVTGNKTGFGLQLQGSAANATGVYIDMNGVTSPNQKAGLTVNNGSVNAGYNADTAEFTPNFFGSIHTLGGNLRISSGFPLLATPFFGNNFGHGITFDDDYTADNLLGAGNSLGFSVNGFLNQMIGATGKTLDTVNYMFAAGSNPSGDGHVVNINMFRTAGFVNAGGAMTADNLRGFYVDPAFDGSITTTNKWGFINASSTNNWMKGSLVLGGTTGLPGGAFALDVTGGSTMSGDLTVVGTANLGNGSNATTQSPGDNSSLLATTSYVDTAVGAVSGITALTGDVTASGSGSVAATLATVNPSPGTYGSATNSITLATNGKGLITSISDTPIQIAESQVTSLVADLAAKQSTTLTDAHILVGNGSNVAADVAVSGDVTLANTGAFTLATSGVSAGTYTKITVDAKGRATVGANLAYTDVPTSTPQNVSGTTTASAATPNYFGDTSGGAFTLTLPAAASNSGKIIFVKNITFGGSNDITIARTGADTIDGGTSDTVTPGDGRQYISNGTNWFLMM